MKKLFLVLSLAAACLTGCSKKTEPSDASIHWKSELTAFAESRYPDAPYRVSDDEGYIWVREGNESIEFYCQRNKSGGTGVTKTVYQKGEPVLNVKRVWVDDLYDYEAWN